MLLYCILGIALITIVLPLIENLMSIVESYTEFLIYKIAYKIYLIKKEMKESLEEEEKQKFSMGFHTQAIGQQFTPTQEED